MADVFVSYDRQDEVIVRQIVSEINDHRIDTWVDWSKIPISRGYWFVVEDAIEEADTFVCVVSRRWLSSPSSLRETLHAIKLKKRVIPLIIEDGIDETLAQQLIGELVTFQNWIFFRETDDFDQSLDSLIKAIKMDLEHARRHTNYQRSAKKWDSGGRKPEYLLRGEELREAVLWLEMNIQKIPEATELHRQFILESEQQAARHSSPIQQAIYAATYRLLGLGPHKIFISYRRADSAYACGWIYDQLKGVFGQKNIFLDVDSIDYGTDFSQFIQKTLTECFVVLVVIGPQWVPILKARGESGEVDFVRTEVELALKRKHVNVIPVLVGEAQMPEHEDLPASMQDLRLKNGKSLGTGRDFHQDMSVLIKELKKLRSQVRIDTYP